MGVIPLEYLPGDTADGLGLTGRERYTIIIPEHLTPRMVVDVKVRSGTLSCAARSRLSRSRDYLTLSLFAPTARHRENVPSEDEV